MIAEIRDLLHPNELESRLRNIGEQRYHDKHPFHGLLHSGKLNRHQVQAWALNRYCYQAVIPKKDAAIMSRMNDPAVRRSWRQRIIDHDGDSNNQGGIERWLKLAEGVGLDRDYVLSQSHALPITRFCVDAYLNFVRQSSVLEGIASSLTEMFSPTIIAERMAGMLANYDFINEDILAYFTPRLTQARRDVDFALAYVLKNATTCEKQTAVLRALELKCDILWSQLDALYFSYVSPGIIPPECFDPQTYSPRTNTRTNIEITLEVIPRFAAQVKLHHDKVRNQWVLQAPERIIELNDTAVDIVKHCNGVRTVSHIIESLTEEYKDVGCMMNEDVISTLQLLADKRYLEI